MPSRYPVPARPSRAEIMVVNSRFIASIAPAFSVDEAKVFISQVRNEFSDASHNVPAFIIGHGSTTITHSHDDGEPAGTAGRPALAVLAGSGLGDAVVVITRYFGGTKLGTGGLVRAYSDAVRAVLAITPRAERIPVYTAMLVVPYAWFERARNLAKDHYGRLEGEDFAGDVTLTLRFSQQVFPEFQNALREASHGSLEAEIIESGEVIAPPGEFGDESPRPE